MPRHDCSNEPRGHRRKPRLRRYGPAARWYDVLSLERPVYRAPRIRGIGRLDLQPGDRILDIACGTGLNFPLLVEAVGPLGCVVGIDASAAMLAGARRRVAGNGWTNVTIEHGQAAELSRLLAGSPPFDAVVITYALSIVGSWRQVFEQAIAELKPGGQLLVIDLALPTGCWRVLTPLAWLACFAGGVQRSRRPWRLVAESLHGPCHEVHRGGHVHIAWGRQP
ncbi:MAG: methyltransferase domain-containing protein [Mycobacteriales bacterium]